MSSRISGWILRLFVVCMMITLTSLQVLAQGIPTEPEGPTTFDVVDSTRRAAAGAATVEAIAGNVTQLSISGSTVTQTWQAYFGNVTGTITLDDSSNHSIYDWQVASPEGEIYASEAAVTFTYSNLKCYDFDMTDGAYGPHTTLAEYEALLGLDPDDPDGINETFSEGLAYDSFYVGSRHIDNTTDVCPSSQMYDENEQQSGRFQEVLLYDNTSNKVVYTALLEEDATGFDGNTWDFEMIVGENGHSGDSTTTTYYFYVELE